MVTSEVQRTLVKSPPELWAELSDPAALARQLGDLGDVGNMRIVRVHAEERVDWEADRISGSVLMKASGWGTKVTLRVSRELGEFEPTFAEAPEGGPSQAVDARTVDEVRPESTGEPDEPQADGAHQDGAVEVEAAAVEASANVESQADVMPEIEGEATLSDEPSSSEESVDEESLLEPRRGFFSRLFRRRRPATLPGQIELAGAAEEPVGPHDDQAQPETPASAPERPASPEPVAEKPPKHEPVAAPDPPSKPGADVSADLKAAEEVAAEEVTAVLTATLDRLGAAHHRPFSRS
jgi:hypothetical protein